MLSSSTIHNSSCISTSNQQLSVNKDYKFRGVFDSALTGQAYINANPSLHTRYELDIKNNPTTPIYAHGTNAFVLLSALTHTNGQLVPLNVLNKFQIPILSGENNYINIDGDFNNTLVSVEDLIQDNSQALIASKYSMVSNKPALIYIENNFKKNHEYNTLSKIPIIIFGDATTNFIKKGSEDYEIGIERLNIRSIYCNRENIEDINIIQIFLDEYPEFNIKLISKQAFKNFYDAGFMEYTPNHPDSENYHFLPADEKKEFINALVA